MELLLTDKRKTVGRASFRGKIRSSVLRYLSGVYIGIMTSTYRLVVMMKSGECQSIGIVSDIIISVRTENILLHETRLTGYRRDIQGKKALKI